MGHEQGHGDRKHVLKVGRRGMTWQTGQQGLATSFTPAAIRCRCLRESHAAELISTPRHPSFAGAGGAEDRAPAEAAADRRRNQQAQPLPVGPWAANGHHQPAAATHEQEPGSAPRGLPARHRGGSGRHPSAGQGGRSSLCPAAAAAPASDPRRRSDLAVSIWAPCLSAPRPISSNSAAAGGTLVINYRTGRRRGGS